MKDRLSAFLHHSNAIAGKIKSRVVELLSQGNLRTINLLILATLVIIIQFPYAYFFFSEKYQLATIALYVWQAILSGLIVFLILQPVIYSMTGKEIRVNSFRVFIVSFLFLLYWLPLGFDVTDEGRRMAHSWFLFGHPWYSNIGLKAGSHMVYSFWLHIIGEPSVLWARLGYALVQSSMVLLIYLLLKREFSSFYAFVGTLISGAIMLIYVCQTINYNNLPVLAVLFSVYFLQTGELRYFVNRRKSNLFFFLSGLVLIFSVFARFPFLVLIFILAIYFITRYLIGERSRDQKLLIRQFVFGYGGIAAGTGLVVLGLWFSGGLGDYAGTINALFKGFVRNDESIGLASHGHDMATITDLYLNNFFVLSSEILKYTGVLALVILMTMVGGAIIGVTTVVAALFFIHNQSVEQQWYYEFLAVILSLAILCFLFNGVKKKHLLLVFWALILLFFSFIGSGNGVLNIITSGGVGLVFALFLTALSEHKIKKHFWAIILHYNFRNLAIPVGVFCAIEGMALKSGFIYRDSSASQLTEMFDAPQLFGIFSTPQRVKVTDDLLMNFEKNTYGENIDLLCVNTLPMFYYLMDIRFGYKKYWNLGPNQGVDKAEFLRNQETAPDIILLSRRNTRDRNWPETDEPCIAEDKNDYEFYVNFLEHEHYYDMVFENSCFSLYHRVNKK